MGSLSLQSSDAQAADFDPGVIVSQNPATGEKLGEVPVATEEEVRAAVARGRAAQREWGRLPVRERARRVFAFRDEIINRAEEVIDCIVREGGKTRLEALNMEVLVAVDLADYFAKRAEKLLAPHPIPLHLLKTKKSYLHYVPRGVIGIISPWNFPFSIPLGETIMGLLAGNAVVVKLSEMTPLTALKAKEVFEACGLPRDLFQVVTGRGATGAALIDSGVDQVIFTGSVATGRKVAAQPERAAARGGHEADAWRKARPRQRLSGVGCARAPSRCAFTEPRAALRAVSATHADRDGQRRHGQDRARSCSCAASVEDGKARDRVRGGPKYAHGFVPSRSPRPGSGTRERAPGSGRDALACRPSRRGRRARILTKNTAI